MVEQNIIPLGAKCKLSGRYEVSATVPKDPLYRDRDNGQTTVVLDFEGVDLSCACNDYYQSKFPGLLHLLLRVNEDQEDASSGKLLTELEKLQLADLNNIPIRHIDEVFSQRDFNTGLRYRTTVITVKRDAVTQETES